MIKILNLHQINSRIYLKKTLPKGVKRLMNCKNDVKSRITLRIEI
jgi:hypothetical protein